jgi:hypothetical protein
MIFFLRNILYPLNAELNPISHLLALLGAHPILHVSRIRVNAPMKTVALRITLYKMLSVSPFSLKPRLWISTIKRAGEIFLYTNRICVIQTSVT